MSKLKVSVKKDSFPIRYNGERFSVGDVFIIDEHHLNKNSMDVLGEVEETKSEFDGKSIDELKAYAAEQNIDLGKASTEEGIIKKIEEAQKTE